MVPPRVHNPTGEFRVADSAASVEQGVCTGAPRFQASMREQPTAELAIASMIGGEKSRQRSNAKGIARSVFVQRPIQSHDFLHAASRRDGAAESRPIEIDDDDFEFV